MINWESIISAFNEDGTLLKWLKTVNKALNEATLTGVTAQNTSETTATITFTFADGTSQTTPPITLPRGAQGIQGPAGPTGAQGPAGPTGAQGPAGENGTNGLNALTCSEVQSTDAAVSDGVTVFMIPTTAFNRAPVAGDTCTIIAQGTATQAGKVWICQCNYDETVIRLRNHEKTVSSEYLFEVVSSAEVRSGGGGGGGTQLYRQTISFTSGSDSGHFIIITTTATAYADGADIYNDWNNVVSAKYGATIAHYDTCLFVDGDSTVHVDLDGIHITNFPPMKVWRTASVTPL